MARAIDGDKLVENLRLIAMCWSVSPYVSKEKHNGAIDMLRAVEREVKKAPTLTPPNEPLTLEQLREMDGDKIAIHYIGDCASFYEDEIASYYGDQEQYIQRYNGMLRACDLPLKYYGTQWTATLYRRPPEREEDTW